MNMDRSNVGFLDLPNEILFIIFKKLDNIDVLYSLVDVDNQRLDIILQGKRFTENLNFVLTTSSDEILSIADSILNRFCNTILPRINHNVKSLIIESESMECILLAADYPNLTQLKLFNFQDKIVSSYFTGKNSSVDLSIDFKRNLINTAQYPIVFHSDDSPFRRIFQQQITDLILVYKPDLILEYITDITLVLARPYPNGVHGYILKFFENLKHLTTTGSPTVLTLRDTPSTICSSSTLSTLCVYVNHFEDCLALLDGRLKQLTTFTVTMGYARCNSSVVYNMNDLPNLKSFSLTCICNNDEYDTHVVPHLRRMFNLEELTLNIRNEDRTTFVDGTQINNEILLHMPRLSKFNFHICTKIKLNHSVSYLSIDDIQRTFTNMKYYHVGCVLRNIGRTATCHVFSIPFAFDHLEYIGNTFPSIVFPHLIRLGVHDMVPFEHEFFVRIARFFPLLKEFRIMNFEPQSPIPNKLDSDNIQPYPILEYPYLVLLCVEHTHIDYVEQFLNETKTYLPRLRKLEVDYDQLTIVTENFTRDATRLKCAKVEKLIMEKSSVHSKDFYVYFPLL